MSIGLLCTVAMEMKTNAKRQKVNTLNKLLIKHDKGISNTKLCLISLQDMILIFRDWTQNCFNWWPITGMKRMNVLGTFFVAAAILSSYTFPMFFACLFKVASKAKYSPKPH